jgi:aspartate/tyrosine/aromatic aminotransferase
MAPPDAILGLTEAFARDPRPEKINLGVGVYQDAMGKTPVLASVKIAEERLLRTEASKDYLGIAGLPAYAAAVAKLLWDEGHPVVAAGRAAVVHTAGGTGALRVAADFLATMARGCRVWLSDPTWPNHPSVFKAAGMETATYPYFDAATSGLRADDVLAALSRIPAGDVVLLHGCCHNPTGVDPTPEQWSAIADIVAERQLLPLVDLAYQGFAEGLDEDAAALRAFAERGCELLVASSFSKNFGLYNERVGALSIVARDREAAEKALSNVKQCVRANYSNPPFHGAAIVATVLGDATLRPQWESEVRAMRERISKMRTLFVKTLANKAPSRDFSFIARQRGMFSFSGLTRPQVDRLREEHGIYIVGNGRINVAGMTEANMDRLSSAVAAVL